MFKKITRKRPRRQIEIPGTLLDGMTLGDARQRYWGAIEDGTVCPCCDRYGKQYTKRTITKSMATALVIVHRYFSRPRHQEWLHVEKHLKQIPGLPPAVRGDFHKLRYWGFLEPLIGKRDDGSTRVGYWRTTPEGAAFAMGARSASRYATVYDKACKELWGDQVYIGDVRNFDYAELMGSDMYK